MENLTIKDTEQKSAEQILIDFMRYSGSKEMRKSFRDMLFAAFRSEWADDINDRMKFLAEFENLDKFLEELEIFEAAYLEAKELQRESEEAERKKNIEERWDDKINQGLEKLTKRLSKLEKKFGIE